MATGGLWLARRRLIAVVVGESGRASPPTTAELQDDARWGLLEQLDAVHGLDVQLVLPETLAQQDSIGRLAVERGLDVWVAPGRLVEALRTVAALATGPPARTAAMIARLALHAAWRGHLRPMTAASDHRQLRLL